MVANRKPTKTAQHVKPRSKASDRKAAEKRALTRATRLAVTHYRSTLDRLAQ